MKDYKYEYENMIVVCLSWINKAKTKDKMYMSVGVMKDYKLETMEVNTFVYYESMKRKLI
jgi:hypothetical protein